MIVDDAKLIWWVVLRFGCGFGHCEHTIICVGFVLLMGERIGVNRNDFEWGRG